MIKAYEGQSREDVAHIQERIDRLRRLISKVEVALMKNDVQGKINENLRRAGSPPTRAEDEDTSQLNLEEIDLELLKS